MTALKNMKNKDKADNYYLYHSLLGEIYTLQNNTTKAKAYFEKGIKLTLSIKEKKFYVRK